MGGEEEPVLQGELSQWRSSFRKGFSASVLCSHGLWCLTGSDGGMERVSDVVHSWEVPEERFREPVTPTVVGGSTNWKDLV